ncbi:AMP-binding protein [Fusobacterium mortiferum]|uniref:AMP-binding protein n=1 Tax=Fusobacterium mortiferum TaxID=850 RepID=UPI0022E35890|nr:AMP-binding protein [Fusobacterium mortiferum]
MKFIYDRNKTAVIFGDREYSYKEIIKGIKYYSTLLKESGKVVVTMENRPEMICSIFSIWDKKETAIVLDSGYTGEQFAYAFSDSEPRHIFTSKKVYERVKEGVELSKQNIDIIIVDDIEIPENFVPENYEVEIDDMERVALLLYTSGTTGNPKGVVLTFNNLESNIRAVREIELVNDQDRVLAILPYHHILPLNLTLLMPMYFGTFLVILEELSSEALKLALKKHQISVIIGVPRVWEMLHKAIMGKINSNFVAKKLFNLCKKVNSLALSKKVFKKVADELGGNMRVLVSGGAKLDPEVSANFKVLGLPIIEGYGLTETSPIIAFNRPNNNVIGSAGQLIPNIEVKIAEDEEILVRGANVMKGYYKNPQATSEAIDSDGWFHTGDLGKFEGDSLFIIGRKKEMIVLSNGKNINPGDIESVILKETDLVKEIAVMEYNNHLMAVVYPDFDLIKRRKIANIKETLKWEIIDKYNVTAPKYRKILEVKIVKDELPKTKLGKIRRFMLKDFLKKSDEEVKENTQEKKEAVTIPQELKFEYETLKKYLVSTFNCEVEPDFHLELDLGLDSLDIVEILSFIETNFGVKISEEQFSNLKSILDIAKFIKENGGEYHEEEMDWKSILNQDIDVPLPKSSFVLRAINIIVKPIFSLYFRLRKIDTDKLVENPALYIGNHQSFLDALIFSQAIPLKKLKDTYFIAVVTHFDTPLRRYLAERGNIIIIDINKNLKETLQISAKVLREEKNLVIFPEGARTRDGELQEFKKTFAILSKELNIPVVPFGIRGAYESMPYGSSFPKSSPIDIKFFDEIEPEELTIDEIVQEARKEINDWLKED